MLMDDQAKFAVTPPPASDRNSNVIVFGLPSSSPPVRLCRRRLRRASVPGKERKIRTKRRRDDADNGGTKPSELGQNQGECQIMCRAAEFVARKESDEHELYAQSQKRVGPCLEKEEYHQGKKVDKNVLQNLGKEGQRFLRKCSNIGSSDCIDTKIRVPGDISLPCQSGVVCASENTHDVEKHLDTPSTCFRKVVSPYFQKGLATGSEEIVDGNKKQLSKKRNVKDKRRCKEKNKHRRKSDKDCLFVENGDTDLQLEAHRTVSPYFQAKVASDDLNLELQKEKAKKEKKRKKSKRKEDDEPLGDRDEEQGCGSNSEKVSPYFKYKNKAAKSLEITSKKCKDAAISGSMCSSEILISAGHQSDDYKTMLESKIQEACISSINKMESLPLESEHLKLDPFVQSEVEKSGAEISANTGSEIQVKHSKRKSKKKKNKDDVSGSEYLFVSGESKLSEESHRRDLLTCVRDSRHFHKAALHITHDDEEKTTPNICRKRKAKTRNIQLEELFAKFAYTGGDITSKDSLKKGIMCGYAVKQTKKLSKASKGLTALEKKAEAYKRRSVDNTWKPPLSPYNLLQEEYYHDPWKVLVICMLLNITTGPQVRRVVEIFFAMCPDAKTAIKTETFEIARVIQSLGLQHKRAAMIQRFSLEYLSDEWTHVTQLHGIGKYAADAYAIFCNGMWNQVKPNDHMLSYYWKFLKGRGLRLTKIIGQSE